MSDTIIIMSRPVTTNKEKIALVMFHSFIQHAMGSDQDIINTLVLENPLHIFEPISYGDICA